jgi:hypothetical protein
MILARSFNRSLGMGRRGIVRTSLCLWGFALPLSAGPSTEDQMVHLRAAGFELAHISPLTVEVMTREVNRLLAVAGARVEWRWVTPGTETVQDELSVVFLDSPCRGVAAGQPLLGTTAAGPSGPAPTIWVYWPNVVHALGFKTDSPLDSFFVKRSLGVALGRVVAHELVHALAPEVPHGSDLMATGLRPEALCRRRLALDATSAALFNAAARSWQRWGGPPPAADRQARGALAGAAAAGQPAAP